MGSESYLHAKMEKNNLIARVSAEETLSMGEKLHLEAAPEHLHLFDVNSGDRIL